MSNDLRMLITGQLNIGKTIGEINNQIKSIEKAIKKLKLKVEVDPKVMNTLTDFSKNLNNVYQNTTKIVNKKTQALKDQEKAVNDLGISMDKLGRKQKDVLTNKGLDSTFKTGNKQTIIRENVDGTIQPISQTTTYETTKLTEEKRKLRQELSLLHRQGKITTEQFKEMRIQARQKESITQIKSLGDELKKLKIDNSLVRDKERLIQRLIEIKREGRLTEQQFDKLSASINSVNNARGLDKVKADLREVQGVLKKVGMFEQLQVAMSRINW